MFFQDVVLVLFFCDLFIFVLFYSVKPRDKFLYLHVSVFLFSKIVKKSLLKAAWRHGP